MAQQNKDSNTGKPEPTIGVLGFYRSDPSHKKSPNIVLGIDGCNLTVFEVPTQMVFEIDLIDWMPLSEMQARIFEVISGHRHNGRVMSDFRDDILKGYVVALVDAVRVAQEIPGIIARYAASVQSGAES